MFESLPCLPRKSETWLQLLTTLKTTQTENSIVTAMVKKDEAIYWGANLISRWGSHRPWTTWFCLWYNTHFITFTGLYQSIGFPIQIRVNYRSTNTREQLCSWRWNFRPLQKHFMYATFFLICHLFKGYYSAVWNLSTKNIAIFYRAWRLLTIFELVMKNLLCFCWSLP